MPVRTAGFGRGEVLDEVGLCRVGVFVRVGDEVVKVLAVVVVDLEDLEFVVCGRRLAGVEINHLIKRKSIGAFSGDAVVGRGDPVRKELKIRWRGSRRLEQTAELNV